MSLPSDWPRVGCTQCHQACDGRNNCLSLISDHHSRARDADIILFQPEFVMTMSVTFCKIDHSKKSHDIVTDQYLVAHNVTQHVMVATTVWVSSLIITVELVTLTLFCFNQNLSWLCQGHLADLITVKKSHDIVTGQAMVAKMSWSMHWSYQSFWVSLLIITIEYVTLTLILFLSDFFYDSDILQHVL